MRNLILISFIALIAFGCSKPLPCEEQSTGILEVSNTWNDPFFIYLNEVYVGNSEALVITPFYNIKAGFYEILFINKNNTNIYGKAEMTILSCRTFQLEIQ